MTSKITSAFRSPDVGAEIQMTELMPFLALKSAATSATPVSVIVTNIAA